MNLLAIDFETADHGPDSACAVGLVKITNGRIISTRHHLIRPPRRTFTFSHIHGISWEDVRSQPDFGTLWPEIEEQCEDAEYFLAHNASFDRNVLRACCERYGLPVPTIPFICTVQVARKGWSIYPTKLSSVCDFLEIDLKHHNAESDALACAQIAISALSTGFAIDTCVLGSQTKSRPSKKLAPAPPAVVPAAIVTSRERTSVQSNEVKDQTRSQSLSMLAVVGIVFLMIAIWVLSKLHG